MLELLRAVVELPPLRVLVVVALTELPDDLAHADGLVAHHVRLIVQVLCVRANIIPIFCSLSSHSKKVWDIAMAKIVIVVCGCACVNSGAHTHS